jgi:hypothetical protein
LFALQTARGGERAIGGAVAHLNDGAAGAVVETLTTALPAGPWQSRRLSLVLEGCQMEKKQ